jgi:hypothetical protein
MLDFMYTNKKYQSRRMGTRCESLSTLLNECSQPGDNKINGSNDAVENCSIHSTRKCYICKIFRNGVRPRRYIQHKIIQQEENGSNAYGNKQYFKMRNFHCAWPVRYLYAEKKRKPARHYPTCGTRPP